MTRLGPRRAWVAAAAMLWLLAGCGGDSSVSVGIPTENNGPPLTGLVAMPNGQVASAASALERLAALAVAPVEALQAANVRPVGAGVTVRLRRIDAGDIRGDRIVGGEVVAETTTAGDGQYGLRMPTGTDPGTCRFLMEVGRGATLTRAFVAADRVDVNFETEAAVRLVLEEIRAGRTGLCDLDAGDLRSIDAAVAASDEQVVGSNAATVNAAAYVAAANDDTVRAAVNAAVGLPTPRPTGTHTAQPTGTVTAPPATATATGTSPPQPTSTALPTRTATAVGNPTNTVQPTRTDTAAPTRTSTPLPTSTTAPTNTTVPTSTAPPTNTSVPTNTIVPTATAVVTSTSAPSATGTAVPTVTPTAASSATITPTIAPPRLDLGVVAGTAGLPVDVPASLLTRDAPIAAVSTDIEFDSTLLSVPGGTAACTVDPRLAGVKQVVARVADAGAGRQRLRVGLIGLDNNEIITSGPVFTCRFLVGAGASGSATLLNAPEFADQMGEGGALDGDDGRIDIAAAPATLALVAGTATAVGETAEVTAALTGADLAIAAVATDIRFPAARLSAAPGSGGAPDCSLDAAVAALGKVLVAGPLPEADGLAGIRVGVVGPDNNTALPDDDATPLFTCRFIVESRGGDIALTQSAEAASPAAQPVGLSSPAGTIPVP